LLGKRDSAIDGREKGAQGRPMADDKEVHLTDLEWENRVLCSDESCIGTIGPDGRCKECGKAYVGPLPEAVAQVQPPEALPNEETSGGDISPGGEAGLPPSGKGGPEELSNVDEWERRTLCADEACIGVIGPDGCCKECGKPGVPKP
jgi:hypothetical protein